MSSTPSRSKRAESSSSSPKDKQKLMTFRYNEIEVWVKLDSYQSAITTAQSEYDDLRNIPPYRIAFHVKFLDSGKLVRISESAWSSMLPKFLERSVIDIKLREARDIKGEDSPPPRYFPLENPEANSSNSIHKSSQPQTSVPHSGSSIASGQSSGSRFHEKFSKLVRK